MNKVILTGRACRDIELNTLPSGSIKARFTLAVDRRKADGGADFINCSAWGKTAELMNQYVHKGDKVGIVGRITTGEYTGKDGIKRFATEVIAEDVEFLQGKREPQTADRPQTTNTGWQEVTSEDDDSLPFD